ncbi:MAG TPA: hypothetical protein PK668_07400 [Myxococcota bacterium]|nr:hypothetical protein [Myxococcota bacterium]HRY92329.1 hypothetical protein [Myxococcota bacterium]HSA22978.1 hypothetical protein [Myxococcota bacterium]
MKTNAWTWVLALLVAALAWTGCDGGSDGHEDAGQDADQGDGGGGGESDGATPCLNNFDCVAPEECIDHVCQVQTVDPDANKVSGRFTFIMNDSGSAANSTLVRGKLDGHGFYMEWGYAEVDAGLGDAVLYMYSILTTDPVDTYNFLVLTVPRQSPVGQNIEVGPTKVARGSLDRVTVDSNGHVTSQTSIATVASGDLAFEEFGTATGARLEGQFVLELEALP